jgi:hypothetical protein
MTVSGVAELMARVGDELPLAGEGAVEPFEHMSKVSASSRNSSRGPGE